jgi:hypothetical protein
MERHAAQAPALRVEKIEQIPPQAGQQSTINNHKSTIHLKDLNKC